MKSKTDDVHRLTEAVYKNLVENFNSGVRQILLTGKAYYKALQAVSVTAQAYNDALGRVGSAAKICRGGTEEIGEAILQIAEAQKEIQIRFEDSTKALFTELILPLEQKLEKDFKKAHSDGRKYTQEHKAVLSPYNKACESLKKFRKKTKNKLVYDNEKEAQHMRTLEKCQEKLDQYRVQGLKLALLEERRCHCFLLQRLCAISQLNAVRYRHGVDLYSSLPEWRQICSNPHILPPSADQLLLDYMDESYEPVNGGPSYHSNGFLHRDGPDTQSLPLNNDFRRSKSTHDLYRQSSHFDGSKTLPPRTAAPLPPRSQVKAMYTFTAGVDNQLSFVDGDVITIMGENSDGWQYGQNNNTQKLGWFPLSFTQPVVNSGRDSQEFKLNPNQRYKSVGDLLDSRSLSEYAHHYDHDIPGNVRRPKSLYEGPHHGASAPQNPHLTTASSSRYGSPSRQQPSQPPPLPPSLHRPEVHDAEIEENVNYRSNPMFASVSLRQTKTNDRSAPKV